MQDIAVPAKPARRRPGKPAKADIIPAETIIELYLVKRLSQSEIARTLGVCHQTINERIKRLGLDSLTNYKNNRADLLALLQRQITDAITASDIQKAPLRDKVVATGILYDKERLERGQATEITDSKAINLNIQALDAEEARLKAKLAQLIEKQEQSEIIIDVKELTDPSEETEVITDMSENMGNNATNE